MPGIFYSDLSYLANVSCVCFPFISHHGTAEKRSVSDLSQHRSFPLSLPRANSRAPGSRQLAHIIYLRTKTLQRKKINKTITSGKADSASQRSPISPMETLAGSSPSTPSQGLTYRLKVHVSLLAQNERVCLNSPFRPQNLFPSS